VIVRGDEDDFQYVLSNSTMTIQENQEMKRFMVWACALVELVLRRIWATLREFAGLTQSTVILAEVFRVDLLAKLVCDPPDLVDAVPSRLPLTQVAGEPYYVPAVLEPQNGLGRAGLLVGYGEPLMARVSA